MVNAIPAQMKILQLVNIHVTRQDEDEPIIHFIATLYIFLIISTIGGMFAHNALDLFKKSADKKIKVEGFYEGRTLRAFTLSQDEFK